MQPTLMPIRTQRKNVYKIIKKVEARIFWCDTCNLPLLTRICGKCNKEGRLVKVTPPADARPALGKEYIHLRQLIEEEIGDKLPYPWRQVILFNKVPYPDCAEEVVIDGYVIGHKYFDLKLRTWRFKPLYVGVSELVKSKCGFYAITDLPRLSRNYEIHVDQLIDAKIPTDKKNRFIALATLSSFEGLGIYTDKKRIRVIKSWKAKNYAWNKVDPSWLDVVKANEARLELLEQEAIHFLKKTAEEAKLEPLVSFSGGKDSLVSYRLSEKAFGKVPIFFNNTGLELPETLDYVKHFAQTKGLELVVADAGGIFWESLEIMGPPARDYRWCCKVVKLIPTARVLKQRFEKGVLSIVGQRKMESAARALSPRVYRNKWIPNVVVAAPIHSWTALEVWLYIFKEKLPVNSLYFRGFDRLGCWLCPAIELGEAEAVKVQHPELWSKWEGFLEHFATKHNLGKEWVDFGLWRWILVPGDIKRLIAKDSIIKQRGVTVAVNQEGNYFVIKIKRYKREIDFERLIEALVTIGNVEVNGKLLTLNNQDVEMYADSDSLEIRVRQQLDPWKIAGTVVRALYCLRCGSCELWCPSGAVKVDSCGFHINSSRCNHCGTCGDVCPLSEYSLKIVRLKEAMDKI
ncbi:MAG: phosphoadenosine phosphosulfate reductase family protein [Thermofilaceae archaeon]|nr:phosphoadenosine phosphosulfate reductase family protein [Thermofilaceae archaeon]